MSQPEPLTEQQLAAVEAKTAELRERLDRKNRWPSDNESFFVAEGWVNGTRNALDKLDPAGLVAEIRRLRGRVTDLEGPAVEARAALAALCYDLEDPGSNALGALYLISRVTVGVEAPRDEAAQVLASHDAQVMRRCAEFVRDTYDGQWADDAAATLERDADVTEHGCPGYEDAGWGDTPAERRLANCKHCGRPRAVCTAAPVPPVAPLAASQPSEAPVEGETAARASTGRVGDPQAPGIRQPVGDLAAADNPTHLRWGLNDVLWSDDDSVIVLLSDVETGKPYWLELDPERAAVLRQDLAGPPAEETHIVADDSSDPEHIDDCPGCDATDDQPQPAV